MFDDSFGASTPVNVLTENLTDENLKIYSIIFWDNIRSGKGKHVNFYKELEPNEKSNDFWFENDGTTEFWIVAKNGNNGIKYLNVVTEREYEFDFKIMNQTNIDPTKIQIAKEITVKKDEKIKIEKFAFWTNILLIGLLILSLMKIKTGGNSA